MTGDIHSSQSLLEEPAEEAAGVEDEEPDEEPLEEAPDDVPEAEESEDVEPEEDARLSVR